MEQAQLPQPLFPNISAPVLSWWLCVGSTPVGSHLTWIESSRTRSPLLFHHCRVAYLVYSFSWPWSLEISPVSSAAAATCPGYLLALKHTSVLFWCSVALPLMPAPTFSEGHKHSESALALSPFHQTIPKRFCLPLKQKQSEQIWKHFQFSLQKLSHPPSTHK